MAVAFVFPGQGSQTVGMGKTLAANFAAARQVFEEVDAALGSKLSTIIFEGPADTLTLTENAQPALMAVSLAAMRVLEAEAGLDLARDAQFVAGHSLGEYSALAAAGAFTVADAARLLRTRGQAMQKAVPVGVGAMAALIGLEFDAASAVAAEAAQGEVCQAANDNGAGQVVVSGNKAAVERAVEIAKTKGAKRAMLLPVSAPFHCALMQPAADVMARGAGEGIGASGRPCRWSRTCWPSRSATRRDCAGAGRASHRYRALARVGCVYGRCRRRRSSMRSAPARFLSGLIKRLAEGATVSAIGSPEDVAAFKAGRNP